MKTDTDEINQLTVVSASPADVDWSDLELAVDGTAADHGMSGTVTAGDMIDITSVAGTGAYTITIRHIPTNTLIGSWDFTAGTVTPTITFIQTDQSSTNTLTVVSVDPVGVLWSDIRLLVDGEARNHGNSGTVNAGDVIDLTSIAGTGEYTVSIIHIPTNTLIGVYEFTGAEISITFVQDEENHTLTVVSVSPDNIPWNDIRIEDGDGFIVRPAHEFVEPGDIIQALDGFVQIYHIPTNTLIGEWYFP
jgi:hypothetical protein